MGDAVRHHCWYAACKTSGCNTAIILDVFAVAHADSAPIYILRQCRAFQETCPKCHQANTYHHGDIHEAILENQTLGPRSRAFVEAREPLSPGTSTQPEQ